MERGACLKQFDRIAQIPRHFSLDQLAQLNFNVTFFSRLSLYIQSPKLYFHKFHQLFKEQFPLFAKILQGCKDGNNSAIDTIPNFMHYKL